MNNTVSILSAPSMQIRHCHYVATRVRIAFICTYIYSFFRRKTSYFCACWLLDSSLSWANPDQEAALQCYCFSYNGRRMRLRLLLLLLLQWTPASAAAAMETSYGFCFCYLLNGRWFAAVAPLMDTYCGYSDKRRLWLLMLS